MSKDRAGPEMRPDLGALSPWAPELARTFVSLASDIALVIDSSGVIRNVAQVDANPISPTAHEWVGRAWIDTVSGDTRSKITNLLREVSSTGIARRREVNHPQGGEQNLPVAYTAIRLGEGGPVLAVGRDLRAVAAIQQRYVESQQALERGYWQARQAEGRYELLFQVATDGVLVLDAHSLQVVEANQAAAALLGTSIAQLRDRHASSAFDHHSRATVNALFDHAQRTGQSGEIRARLLGNQAAFSVVATPFRSGGAMRLLVRVRPFESADASASLKQNMARLVDNASEGVAVTDSSARILVANPAFLALVQASAEHEVNGRTLMSWLGLTDDPFAALVAKVRRDGIARHVGGLLKRADGKTLPVEISAALLTEGDQECIGFTLHAAANLTAPLPPLDEQAAHALTRVLHAGVEALGGRLDPRTLSMVAVHAAPLLGLSAEALLRRLRPGDHAATDSHEA